MFYEKQPAGQQEEYKELLRAVGSLSNIFAESDNPYLYYRSHENIFCRAFDAKNLSREDCSADAEKNRVGIGLKTWVGSNDQKVAEFGDLLPEYEGLTGIDLVRRIAEYRNARISTTIKLHGIREMLYHVVKRKKHAMIIMECAFDPIDIEHIRLIAGRGKKNNIYFTDGKHTYHFSRSKHTLYMIFDDLTKLDEFKVEILADPYAVLKSVLSKSLGASGRSKPTICLRLYSTKADGTKYVPEKSGLNQWNGARTKYKTDKITGQKMYAGSTPRNVNELYIPYPAEDKKRVKDFFPPRDEKFTLRLPDGTEMSAKVCQDDGKAIMSDPNADLGKWLLRDVFELPEGKAVTYEMLLKYGIDCAVFTKEGDHQYSVDFGTIGTYEAMLSGRETEE